MVLRIVVLRFYIIILRTYLQSSMFPKIATCIHPIKMYITILKVWTHKFLIMSRKHCRYYMKMFYFKLLYK